MTGDILQHHDSIVDHETGGDGQGHQRQVVEAEIAEIHRRKGANQRDRNGHRRDQRRPPGAQKQEHHEDHQRHRDHQRLLDFLQRGADGRRAVLSDLQVDSRRNGFLQLRQAGANAVDRLDDIGFRQLADHQQNCRLRVGHPGVTHILHRIADLRDVAKTHRRAVVGVYDQRLVFRGGFELIVRLYLPARAVIFQRPLRSTDVGVIDSGAHGVQRHALVKQRLRVEVDAHRGQRAAAHVDVADAVNLGDGLRQLSRGKIVQLALGVGIRGEREDHNRRIGRVGLAIGRATWHAARQQALRGVDRRLYIAGGAVDISVEIELHNNARAAQRTGGGHFRHPGDPAERAFKRRGHRRGHGFR